jgi:uncharacterized protein (DUF1501 family)
MLIKRRDFIKFGSLATGSLLVPKFLQAMDKSGYVNTTNHNKVLVVLQLSGGNDGLNTVIPIRNDIYYKSRPSIAIKKASSLTLNEEVGLNAHLPFLKELYDEGNLAILNNVGYENPNRSHFRSMDIWQSASKSDVIWQTGWIGRFLDKKMSAHNENMLALEVDDTLSLALKGKTEKAIASRDLKKLYHNSQQQYFKSIANSYEKRHHLHHQTPIDYLYQTMASTIQQVDYIFENSSQSKNTANYPNTSLGKGLKNISSLISSDINTKIYYLSIGSFDTHNNQNNRQENLFKQINEALTSFVKDLKSHDRFQDVLIFTFSEFGRRVSQNASNGTDHGTANNMFFISGDLKQKGLINEMPNLNSLVDGDLIHTIDFKSVYATILDKWLNTNHKTVLGESYNLLNFV